MVRFLVEGRDVKAMSADCRLVLHMAESAAMERPQARPEDGVYVALENEKAAAKKLEGWGLVSIHRSGKKDAGLEVWWVLALRKGPHMRWFDAA
jgi:hypothetical protein